MKVQRYNFFENLFVPSHHIMNTCARHIRRAMCLAAVLLCWGLQQVASSTAARIPEQVATAAGTVLTTPDIPCVAVCEKDNDKLRAMEEAGQWGLPSTSVTLQGTASRTLTVHEGMQRIGRTYGIACPNGAIFTHTMMEGVHHTLSTKRFHIGYYIYYRCQMRC